jgi:hypothetical protein
MSVRRHNASPMHTLGKLFFRGLAAILPLATGRVKT